MGGRHTGEDNDGTSLPLCIPFEVVRPWPPAGSQKNAFVARSKDAVRCCGKSNRRGSARLKKKIKDKKQISLATWGPFGGFEPKRFKGTLGSYPFSLPRGRNGFGIRGGVGLPWEQRLGEWELGRGMNLSLLQAP